MRHLVLFAVLSGLALLAFVPADSKSTEVVHRGEYDRGYNEGYRRGTYDTFTAAVQLKHGEFLFDETNYRHTFRWNDVEERQERDDSPDSAHVDRTPAVDPPPTP